MAILGNTSHRSRLKTARWRSQSLGSSIRRAVLVADALMMRPPASASQCLRSLVLQLGWWHRQGGAQHFQEDWCVPGEGGSIQQQGRNMCPSQMRLWRSCFSSALYGRGGSRVGRRSRNTPAGKAGEWDEQRGPLEHWDWVNGADYARPANYSASHSSSPFSVSVTTWLSRGKGAAPFGWRAKKLICQLCAKQCAGWHFKRMGDGKCRDLWSAWPIELFQFSQISQKGMAFLCEGQIFFWNLSGRQIWQVPEALMSRWN